MNRTSAFNGMTSTSISHASFAAAQASERENWIKDTANDSRILYELVEHSTPAVPLRRLTQGRRFQRGLEVGVGCFGLGFLSVHLTDVVDTIDGIDPLSRLELTMRDRALQAYIDTIRNRVNYIQAAAESIPAPDASYDLIACINVVDHARSPEVILREIERVLTPGGILVFAVSTLSAVGEMKWKLNRWRRPNDWHFVAHPHTYQWSKADRLVRTVRGRVLWNTRPALRQRIAGRGRMSFWILEKQQAGA